MFMWALFEMDVAARTGSLVSDVLSFVMAMPQPCESLCQAMTAVN